MSLEAPSTSPSQVQKAAALLEKIREMQNSEKITVGSVFALIVTLMEAAEKFIKAQDREKWVLDAAKLIVSQHTGMSIAEKNAIILIIDMQAPAIIALVVNASKGLYTLNKSCKCCK